MERFDDQPDGEKQNTPEPSRIEASIPPDAPTPPEPGPLEPEIELRVTRSPRDEQAFLSLRANPPSPYPFTVDTILQALNGRGVVAGLLVEDIQSIVDNQKYVAEFPVAKAEFPEEGTDARIELLFDPCPKIGAGESASRVDWHEVSLITNVEENQPVARKIPAMNGNPGLTVTGKKIEPRKTRDVALPAGRGTKVNPADPNELLAATSGSVRMSDKRVVVENLLNVPHDVDFSVGNIDIHGSVRIAGNVLPGFRVRATGDIHIMGCVEAATIEAGESVWVTQGILGHANKTTVLAGKDVAVRFARNATITAGGNITINWEAVNCHIVSGGVISVGSLEGKRGKIAGGQLSAATAIHAVDLGAESGTTTIVGIAVESSAHSREAREAADRMASLRERHAAVTAEAAKLTIHKFSDPTRWGHSQEQQLSQLTTAASQIEAELQAIEDRLVVPVRSEQQRIVVQGTLFPGVRITIGHMTRSFSEKLSRVLVVASPENSEITTLGI